MRDPIKLPPYAKLRGLLAEHRTTYKDLATILACSTMAVSNRMNAVYPWHMDEAYAILQHFGKPETDIYLYFPPHGETPKQQKATTAA